MLSLYLKDNVFAARDLEPSAILLVRNSYAPNLQIVGTLDVIIDFHPSGVCAAELEVSSMT